MKKMLKSFAYYLFGTFLTRIVQFLFLPLYTSYISAADYGRYDTIHAYVQVLLPVLFQALWDAVLRLGFEQKSREERERFYSTVVPYVLLLGGVFLLAGIVLQLCGVQYAVWVALMIVMSGLLAIWQGASRALEDSRAYAVSNVVSASTSIGINVLLVAVFHMGLQALMISYIVSNFVTVLVVEGMIGLRRHVRIGAFSKPVFREVLRYSRHFIIATTAWKLLGLCSPLVIPWLLGYAANGIYSVALRFQAVLSTITLVYNMAWQEEMIRRADDAEKQQMFNNIYRLLLRLCFGVLFALLPVTYLVYPWFVRGEYAQSLVFVPVIYLECIITTLVSHISSVFIMAKDTLANLVDTVSGAVVSIVLMILLGSQFGLYGIAFASLGGAFWRLLLCRRLAAKYLAADIRPLQLLLYCAAYGGLALLLRGSGVWLQVWLLFAAGVAALALNRELLRQLLQAVKARLGDAA